MVSIYRYENYLGMLLESEVLRVSNSYGIAYAIDAYIGAASFGIPRPAPWPIRNPYVSVDLREVSIYDSLKDAGIIEETPIKILGVTVDWGDWSAAEDDRVVTVMKDDFDVVSHTFGDNDRHAITFTPIISFPDNCHILDMSNAYTWVEVVPSQPGDVQDEEVTS